MYKIYSIFGQLDRVAAQILIDEGKATKIDPVPAYAPQFNDIGVPASFAVIIPTKAIDKRFRELIAELRE
jgi:hypothetical protein